MRVEFSARRDLRIFYSALKNELAIDCGLYNKFGVNPKSVGYLPRPTKWLHRVRCKLFFLNLFSFFLKLFWVTFGPIYFSIDCFKVMKGKYKFASCPKVNSGKIIILYSSRAYDVSRSALKIDRSFTFLRVPWVSVNVSKCYNQMNILGVATYGDIARAFILSVISIYYCFLCRDRSSILLQSYDAFRWFFVNSVLKKISADFYIAEHFDRWAVLTDWRVFNCSYDSSLSLMQHGAVVGKCESFPYLLFYKLHSVSKLFYYEDNAVEIFTKHIFSPVINLDEESLFRFKFHLHLAERVSDSKVILLFVGHPICEPLHIFLYKKIEKKEIIVFYKPHPTSDSTKVLKRYSWRYVHDKDYFPNVDILVSYPSSLVDEYSFHNVDIVLHPLNSEDNQMLYSETLNQLYVQLNKYLEV